MLLNCPGYDFVIASDESRLRREERKAQSGFVAFFLFEPNLSPACRQAGVFYRPAKWRMNPKNLATNSPAKPVSLFNF
jgi:hypothetical protein